ncbi:GNAT family N-acetyltransferase [Paenibacillus fonticola]|uniref:GNAT family N-acetyltransferase n=1 Tax=Paenibacillus fonticola TaxID=379896 RepID=UPI000373BFC5|nr:GNAT family N-acetyltransferase [Paenibacillus fonticola]
MIRSYMETDLNYIVEAHCRIYQQEYKFDDSFTEFITSSINHFLKNKDDSKENIWFVDQEGILKGSIGIVKVSDEIAQLRWFLIEPDQRGKGLGNQLIHEAISFCKDNHYKTIILWTNQSLHAARKLYEKNGFKVSEVKKSYLSNQEIVEEKWEILL